MNSIGERLREERLRRGIDLDRIAEQTKINPSLLQAIETDDYEKLPGSFFARSFVRQYARALGLDEVEFEAELKRLADEQPSAPSEPQEIYRQEFEMAPLAAGSRLSVPRAFGSWLAVLLVVAAVSGIYVLSQRGRELPMEPLPTALQEPLPAQEPLTPAAPEPEPAAPPAVPVRIEVRATEPSWIRVTADGEHVFTGTLGADQSRTFEGKQALRMRTGNAGALQVLWNGKPVGEVGPAGQIRNLEFTPDAFYITENRGQTEPSPNLMY